MVLGSHVFVQCEIKFKGQSNYQEPGGMYMLGGAPRVPGVGTGGCLGATCPAHSRLLGPGVDGPLLPVCAGSSITAEGSTTGVGCSSASASQSGGR